MDWILGNKIVLYTIIYLIVILILTFIAFVLAAFESEHYLNSPFRGGKKISFKRAVRNYLTGLYIVVFIFTAFAYGINELFKVVGPTVIWIICIGSPILASVSALLNSKNEKYMFLKIKEFIEGFLTILTILAIIAGGIGYYLAFFQ